MATSSASKCSSICKTQALEDSIQSTLSDALMYNGWTKTDVHSTCPLTSFAATKQKKKNKTN